MAKLKSEVVEVGLERKIIIGMIVSTMFCQEIVKMYKPEYIEDKVLRILIKWVIDYYERYNKAPGKSIEDIYHIERKRLPSAERRIVKQFLKSISKEFSSESFNSDYILDKSRVFFEEKSIEILFEKGSRYLDGGRPEKAKELISQHEEIIKVVSNRFNPLDLSEVNKHDHEKRENRLFKFPGALGKLFGYFESGWLVSWQGPEKRGKSWWLQEAAFRAITSKIPTVIFSLEMNPFMVKGRIYKKITGMPDEVEDLGLNIFPVFDCYHNQTGSCKKKERVNKTQLRNKLTQAKPKYSVESKYRPCTYCRGDKKYWKDYKVEYWYDHMIVESLIKKEEIKHQAIGFKRMYGDNLRVKCYPAYSANLSDIIRDLDELEKVEGFIPKLIIIDYFDIMDKETKRYQQTDDRGHINATWMRGKYLAEVRNCCVMTGDQSNKKSRMRKSISEIDTSEDKRKDAHVDMKISLNQTPEEKNQGVMRLGVMLHRHKKVIKGREVLALQHLTLGQALLDSEFWIDHERKEETEKIKKMDKGQ